MFGSTKVKIAAGLATGAISLGAAGAYAASNGNTISIANAQPVTVNGAAKPAPALLSLSGKAVTIDASAFSNKGACVSAFANSKVVLKPSTAGATTVSKNAHGKMVSAMQSWCDQFKTSKSAAEAQTAETPDATEPTTTDATDATDATDSSSTHGQSGKTHGHGHGHGGAND